MKLFTSTGVDTEAATEHKTAPKAEAGNPMYIGATMPSKVLDIKVAVGDKVKSGDVVCVTEAMKMEYAVTAKEDGTVQKIHAQAGDLVEGGDLIFEMS